MLYGITSILTVSSLFLTQPYQTISINQSLVTSQLCIPVPSKTKKSIEEISDDVQIAVPDEQTFLVRSLLDYEAPHYKSNFTIAGCPPGLEILAKYEHLVINRRLMNTVYPDSGRRYQCYSQYDVKNSRGMHLYIALEHVEKSTLKWVRDARLFDVSFFDFNCRKVFTVKRTSSIKYNFAQYVCLFCTFGFKGFGNSCDVYLPDGAKLGCVSQKLSFSSMVLKIHNNSGKVIMIIDGLVADGILDVTIPDEDEPIAMIETLMNSNESFDFYRAVLPRYSIPYGITFFKSFVSPEEKALLLGAVILMDFIILNRITDYPHIAEVIPEDYGNMTPCHVQSFRSGSKELIIMTESGKKHVSAKTFRLKDGVVCCKWCTQIFCICCFLGVKRNLVRCILLFISIIFFITLFYVLSIFKVQYLF